MTTRSLKRIELAVYGFANQFKLFQDIPNVIKDLIIEFAKFYFNWKNSKSGDASGGYQFNDQDPTRIIKPKRSWVFLAMDDVLSLDICKKFIWEFQILQLIEKSFVAFEFGVVQHPRDESITDYNAFFGKDETTRSRQFNIFIDSTYTKFRVYNEIHDADKEVGSQEQYKWKKGDKFGIIVDFEKKEMSLMYNGENIDIVYKNLPEKIVPTVALCEPMELICTKYEFQY